MSVSTHIAALGLITSGLVTQVTGLGEAAHGFLDTVRSAATQHELALLKRAYLLDLIGGVVNDDVDCETFAHRRLIVDGRDSAKDFWGNPYQMDVGARQVRFWSNGPDGNRNTVDDIEVILPIG